MSPRRRDGICPHCGVNPRTPRPDGTLRGWCRPCEAERSTAWSRTEAGKESVRRYQQSPKGKATQRRAYRRLQHKQAGIG